jgi:hypothetical protein
MFFFSLFNFRFFLKVDSGDDDDNEQKLVIINKVFPNAFDEDEVTIY